jgi:hypothetical protein
MKQEIKAAAFGLLFIVLFVWMYERAMTDHEEKTLLHRQEIEGKTADSSYIRCMDCIERWNHKRATMPEHRNLKDSAIIGACRGLWLREEVEGE